MTVTPDTHYTKSTGADAKAIAAGMCLGARGTKDGSGALQATAAIVRPAVNGACGGGGGECCAKPRNFGLQSADLRHLIPPPGNELIQFFGAESAATVPVFKVDQCRLRRPLLAVGRIRLKVQ